MLVQNVLYSIKGKNYIQFYYRQISKMRLARVKVSDILTIAIVQAASILTSIDYWCLVCRNNASLKIDSYQDRFREPCRVLHTLPEVWW
ncbi:hypothetical protein Y032_0189g1212 [Ancylostoma ceylanicum]|nr:hypothetical protein Y032_0189g1212 [Ancylostoma ceylanicum]